MFNSLANPWSIAYQAPLSMEFSRQQYWSGLLFPSSEYLHNPGIESMSPDMSPCQADSLPLTPEKLFTISFPHIFTFLQFNTLIRPNPLSFVWSLVHNLSYLVEKIYKLLGLTTSLSSSLLCNPCVHKKYININKIGIFLLLSFCFCY